MTFQYPEIDKSSKAINDVWKNPENKKCNSKEIHNPDSETQKLNSEQSPININTESAQECHLLCKLDINYKPSKCHVERTEQGIIKFNWDKGSYINYNNTNYELKHIQFHTPSLHHIDNNSSEMEVNFYHYNYDSMEEMLEDDTLQHTESVAQTHSGKKIREKLNEKLPKELKESHPHTEQKNGREGYQVQKGIIISVLINHSTKQSQTGETMASRPNMFMSQFIHNEKFLDLNKKTDATSKDHQTYDIEVHEDWSLNDLIPKVKSYYTYDGSIPFPPCMEKFKWVVFDHHTEIIEEFVNIMRSQGNSNGYRDTHPLNNRIVFYNNNIETTAIDTTAENESKHETVKKILSPIRIVVDNRIGYEYRLESERIINKYTSGTDKNYLENQTTLDRINKSWDAIGKIGYQERSASDLTEKLATGQLGNDEIYFMKHIVFDKNVYDGKYFEDTLPFLGLTLNEAKTMIGKTDPTIDIKELVKEMSDVYTNFTDLDKFKDYKTFEDELIKELNSKNNFPTVFALLHENNEKMIFYFMLEWDIEYNTAETKILNLMMNPEKTNEFMTEFWKRYFGYISKVEEETLDQANKKEKLSKLIFKSQSEDLRTTINNHNCQNWGSNSVHHEGSFTNSLSKNINLNQEGYTLKQIEDMEPSEERRIKTAIRDGLLDKMGDKYVPNNKCRNPNGNATAPWCYTTNPKVRWDYCMRPDISFKTRKYILVIIFLMLIYLSYYLVKLIFRYNMFNKFMAMMTGAQLPKDIAYKANQIASTVKNNLRG